MRALVIYESMYGNTHTVADAIGAGLLEADAIDGVQVLPVGRVAAAEVAAADLVVVGGPTHVHSMSRPTTRQSAMTDAEEHPDKHLAVDPDAQGEGVREWLASVQAHGTASAAFDTRMDIAAILSGRASKAISKAMRHHGFHEVVEPESFLVDKETVLLDGEVDRAREWGRALADQVPARTAARS